MRRSLIIFIGIFIIIGIVYADVPRIISHQGRLTDSSGNSLTGTYSLTFRLYEAETGGSAIWTEIHSSQSLTNGIYNVYLGSITALDSLAFDKAYWLSIEINSDGEMSPRSKLTTSGYAFRAIYSDTSTTASSLSGYSADSFVFTTGGTISGNLSVIGNLTANKLYGDGSNLTGISSSTIDTTAFLLKTDAIYSDSVSGITTSSVDTSSFILKSETISGDSVSGGTLTSTAINTSQAIITSGNITAAKYYGDGSNLSGINVTGTDTTLFIQKTDIISSDSIDAIPTHKLTGTIDSDSISSLSTSKLTSTITSDTIEDGSIVDTDISSSADIAPSKIQGTARTNSDSVSASDISPGTLGSGIKINTDQTITTGDTVYAQFFLGDGRLLSGVLKVTDPISGDSITEGTIAGNVEINTNKPITTTDTITATIFVGDGSGLTNIQNTGTTKFTFLSKEYTYPSEINLSVSATSDPTYSSGNDIHQDYLIDLKLGDSLVLITGIYVDLERNLSYSLTGTDTSGMWIKLYPTIYYAYKKTISAYKNDMIETITVTVPCKTYSNDYSGEIDDGYDHIYNTASATNPPPSSYNQIDPNQAMTIGSKEYKELFLRCLANQNNALSLHLHLRLSVQPRSPQQVFTATASIKRLYIRIDYLELNL